MATPRWGWAMGAGSDFVPRRNTRSKRRRSALLAVLALTIATLQFVAASPSQAADGTILRTITAENYSCSVGVGIAFDGSDLLLSCDTSATIQRYSPADGSFVGSFTASGVSSLGALAWDSSRNQLWACDNYNNVVLIDPATGTSTFEFTTQGCFDGLAYDGTDDTVWASADAAGTFQHYGIDGALLASYPWTGGCGNSGLAIGGPYLFLANNGCSQIYRAPKTDPTAIELFGAYPARLEDLECDDLTFKADGKAAIWSKDAYDGVLNAFELNPGDCGFGGQPPTPDEIDYVALGDSYSSGEGTFNYDVHKQAQKCHRGPLAWPRLVEQYVEEIPRIEHKACTGAKTGDTLQEYKANPAQIVSSSPDSEVELVTITIGGNDVGFGGILRDCYLPGGTCADDPDSAGFNAKLRTLKAYLTVTLYPAIESAYPDARIVHVGYPRLTPKPGVTPYRCGWLGADEQTAGVKLAQKLNDAIEAAADTRSRIEFLDVTDVLDGHELCTIDSWMIDISTFGGTERGHPNASGQFALAGVIASDLGYSFD